MKRLLVLAGIILVLFNGLGCGGGSSEDGSDEIYTQSPPQTEGWITIYSLPPDNETIDDSITLEGGTYIVNDIYGYGCGLGSELPGVKVTWVNETTGESGDAWQKTCEVYCGSYRCGSGS